MALANDANGAVEKRNISDVLTQFDSIKSVGADTNQKVKAAKMKELEELAKLVTVLEDAANGKTDTSTSTDTTSTSASVTVADSEVSQTLEFIQTETTTSQQTAKKKEGEDLLSQKAPDVGSTGGANKLPVEINGQTYIVDVIPFKAFVEQLKQRLEQALNNIEMHKSQIAAYNGDTVAADGSVTHAANGGIMGQLVSAIIDGGDAKAQQTITDSIKDFATGLTNLGGGAITEAIEGTNHEEQGVVNKAQNALDMADKIPENTALAGQLDAYDPTTGAPNPDARSQSMKNAINDLQNGRLDFKKGDTHFGSTRTTKGSGKSQTEKFTKIADRADLPQNAADKVVVNTSRPDAEQVTVEAALAAATPTERAAIRKTMVGQLKKAQAALDTKNKGNMQRRQTIQGLIQAGSQAGGGGINILKAALQKQESAQQALQTSAQSVNDTSKSMMKTSEDGTSTSKQSIKETQQALDSIIRIVNQRA